jgi:alpha-L-rhamnosidase
MCWLLRWRKSDYENERHGTMDLKISGMTCEHLENPLGIDIPEPSFGWIVESGSQRNWLQKSYRLKVSSDLVISTVNMLKTWPVPGRHTESGCMLFPDAGHVWRLVLSGLWHRL